MEIRQNINLLNELNVQPISPFNTKLILEVTAAWIVLLSIIYFVGSGINTTKKEVLSKLEVSEKNLLSKIASYDQEEILARENMESGLGNIAATRSSNSMGFSRYLEDLARLTPQGVWLTYFSFAQLGKEITIKGRAIAASGVSIFLDVLNESASLSKKRFKSLDLEKDVGSSSVDFSISTSFIKGEE